MTDQTTTNVQAKAGANIEDRQAILLFRNGTLTAENRALRADLNALLTALGLDPNRDDIEDAVAAAEALVSLL